MKDFNRFPSALERVSRQNVNKNIESLNKTPSI